MKKLFALTVILFSPYLRGEILPDPAAIADGVPEVSIVRLRTILAQNPSPEEWRAGAEKLVEALVAANQPEEALKILDDARLHDSEPGKFWRAQALAELHRWNEALPLYESVAATPPSSFHFSAVLGAAEMLRAVSRREEALKKLAPFLSDKQWGTRAGLRSAELFLDQNDTASARKILDRLQITSVTERKMRRFLYGRVEMVEGHHDRALAIFESLLKRSEGVSHGLAVATLFAVADVHLQMKTPEAGDDFIEDFIDHHPGDVDLPRIFSKLDELYRAERKPARAELERWTREPEQPRRAFAQWYLARIELRAGHRDRALLLFTELRRSPSKIPAVAAALLEFAQFELEDRQPDEALAILEEARRMASDPGLRDRINLLAAQVHYHARRFDMASTAFQQVANSDSPFKKMSIYNASLGWLQTGDQGQFLAAFDAFENQGGDKESRAQLRLEEGLLQAAKNDNNATTTLKNFLRDFPQDPRASEGWIALAEMAFHAKTPRLDEARQNLARALESKPNAIASERGDYLAIWIEDAGGANEAKVIELAADFLKRHEASAFAPDVRLKLAETYYRRQDFANAQTQFELLAQQNPNGPLTERALFFAGESALSSMAAHSPDRALILFDQVVQLKGNSRWAARNEQAVIERKLGKPNDALALYDEVLKSDARPGEKREALCGKGDIYFDLAANDPKSYDQAIQTYDQLSKEAGDSEHWRNQALFKKGICLEKKADRSGALTTFYQVIEEQRRPNRAPELFWFYKAGFNAARLLEEDSKWESAASIYEKLASAGGARADEARTQLDRVRLEHFLWQE